MKVTESDLLQALRDALQKPGDGEGQTVSDLSLSMNCSEEKVRRALRELHRQGRLSVASVRRPSIDGRMFSIPAYQVK